MTNPRTAIALVVLAEAVLLVCAAALPLPSAGWRVGVGLATAALSSSVVVLAAHLRSEGASHGR